MRPVSVFQAFDGTSVDANSALTKAFRRRSPNGISSDMLSSRRPASHELGFAAEQSLEGHVDDHARKAGPEGILIGLAQELGQQAA
jgi:hypothetical protein